MKRKPCIILTGPTAVGKTDLSIALAKALNGSIVSADSMQVYKGMNIGSAKIRPEEMKGIPHYLIDCVEPEEEFDVTRFQRMALEAMEDIYQNGRLPIITGGTGFYIQALLRGIDFSKGDCDPTYRADLLRLAEAKGDAALHAYLAEVDPESAKKLHPHDRKRVIRALEYFRETGTSITTHNREQMEKTSDFCFAYFVLNDERARLYERINQRVDQMIAEGLVDEVRALKARGLTSDHISMMGLGYKELFPYLEGACSLETAVEKIKQETRHFAKRQITWFKREQDVIWVNKPDFDYDENRILSFLLETWERILSANESQKEGISAQ